MKSFASLICCLVGVAVCAAEEVKVPAASQKLLGLSVSPARVTQLADTVSLPGMFSFAPDSELCLNTPVAGRIRLLIKPLQRVKAGEPLYTLESPEIAVLMRTRQESESELVARRAATADLKRRVEAHTAAGVRNAELETLYLQAQSAERLAEITNEKALAQMSFMTQHGSIDSMTLTMMAPHDGTARFASIAEGQWCEQGLEVIHLKVKNDLFFTAYATAAQTEGLRSGMPVTLTRKNGATIANLKLLRDEVIDPATRMSRLYAIVSEQAAAGAQAGESAVMTVERQSGTDIVIPRRAWFLEGVTPTVFVQAAAGSEQFSRRVLEVRFTKDGFSSVKGLKAGELVVVDGVYELKNGFPAAQGNGEKPKKAGHFHADGVYHEGAH